MNTNKNYKFVILQKEPTRSHKREWLRMINKFRSEYFADKGDWYPITPEQLNHSIATEKRIFSYMLYYGNQCVAIAEIVIGWYCEHRTLGIATLYVKPTHRSQGLSVAIYDEIERMAQELDCWFNIQVEQTVLDHNRDKFLGMGFVTYEPIPEFSNGVQYKEQTYALFKGYHLKRLRPLGNYQPLRKILLKRKLG